MSQKNRKKPSQTFTKIAIQRNKVAWEEWLKYTNNEASAQVFNRWRKLSHNNIINCEKLKYIRNIIDY